MIRQPYFSTTLASALVMAQADPAAAQQTAAQAAEKAYQAAVTAQAQEPQVVIPPVQVDRKALEELARGQAVRFLDQAKLMELRALELEARLPADFAGQVGQAVVVPRPIVSGQSSADRERSYYDKGTQALDSGKWQTAVDAFDQVIKLGGTRTDGALYWKAVRAEPASGNAARPWPHSTS